LRSQVLPEHLDQILHPKFADTSSDEYKSALLAKGLPASPGAAVGKVAFSNEKVVANKEAGIPSVLVRDETSPDDVEGMYGSEGILTARGGMTSHAAVVARGWGRPCICGCSALRIDEKAGTLVVELENGETRTFKEGDDISLNGNTGEILGGELAVYVRAKRVRRVCGKSGQNVQDEEGAAAAAALLRQKRAESRAGGERAKRARRRRRCSLSGRSGQNLGLEGASAQLARRRSRGC
jgi:phosphohistidine swiveling domain-containing protein